MTDKITLTQLTSLQNDTTATTAINANSNAITAAIDNTLSRDGTQPLRLIDLNTFIGGGTLSTIPAGGTTGQVLGKNSNTNYDTTWIAQNSNVNAANITSGTLASARQSPANLASSANGGVTGNLPVTNLNAGTSASSSTFWRGDGSWASPTGSGTVTGPGTSTVNNVAIWNGTNGVPLANSSVPVSALPTSIGNLPGVVTNSNATTGNVGEYVSSTATVGSVTSGAFANVTSMSLTAGDWDVWGNIFSTVSGTTLITSMSGGASLTSGSIPAFPNAGSYFFFQQAGQTGANVGGPLGIIRISLSATSTVFLVGISNFSGGTNGYNGFIGARRVR
jgi:hypothetical protein